MRKKKVMWLLDYIRRPDFRGLQDRMGKLSCENFIIKGIERQLEGIS